MKRIFLIILSCTLFASCQWDLQRWLGTPDQHIVIERYDQVIEEYVNLNSYSALQKMSSGYALQTSMLIEDVLSVGSVNEPDIDRKLQIFYRDSIMRLLSREIRQQYVDLTPEEKMFTTVFQALKEADSSFVIPCVYTQNSGLNQSIIVSDSLLGISLDKYLGENFPLYRRYYYRYQRSCMNRQHLVPDALYYYISDFYDMNTCRQTLLERMVSAGKIYWIIAHLLSLEPNSKVFHFSQSRLEWCYSHEAEIWQWMTGNGILLSQDCVMNQDMMEPRDHTPGLGSKSADRLGLWIGLRIVDSYMHHHSKVHWQDLLHLDAKTLFKESSYNPK